MMKAELKELLEKTTSAYADPDELANASARLAALAPSIAAALLEAIDALEFYADKEAYDFGGHLTADWIGDALEDEGAKARAALARIDALMGSKAMEGGNGT